ELHRNWGHDAMARFDADARALPPLANPRDPDRLLRIAYIGLDVSSAESYYFFEPLIALLDRSAFEFVVYRAPSEIGPGFERLRKLTKHRQVLLPHRTKEQAQMIRRDRIDIAIDPAGHLSHGRLDIFALAPA